MKLPGIINLEQGRRLPTWDTVIALCKALNVKCDAFMQEPADLAPLQAGRPKKADLSPPAKPEKKKHTRWRTVTLKGGLVDGSTATEPRHIFLGGRAAHLFGPCSLGNHRRYCEEAQ
jgi:hypothetical protein